MSKTNTKIHHHYQKIKIKNTLKHTWTLLDNYSVDWWDKSGTDTCVSCYVTSEMKLTLHLEEKKTPHKHSGDSVMVWDCFFVSRPGRLAGINGPIRPSVHVLKLKVCSRMMSWSSTASFLHSHVKNSSAQPYRLITFSHRVRLFVKVEWMNDSLDGFVPLNQWHVGGGGWAVAMPGGGDACDMSSVFFFFSPISFWQGALTLQQLISRISQVY